MRRFHFVLLAIFLGKPMALVAAQSPHVAPQVATQQAQSSQLSRPIPAANRLVVSRLKSGNQSPCSGGLHRFRP